MKECSKCHRSDVEFAKNKSKPDGLQTQCKNCKPSTDAAHYAANRENQIVRVKNRKRKIRQFLFDYLKEHPCVDCGEADPVVLEFDHIGDKKINLSEVAAKGMAMDKITQEIMKCEVRCSNCHARKTAKEFGWYKDLV